MKRLSLLFFTLPLAFTSCGSDDKDENDIKLSKTEYVLNYEDEVQIEATSKLNISYSTESKYVADVSASGLITAGRIGKTNILLANGEDSKVVSVTVEPKYDLFPEPIYKIKFGASTQDVKSAFGNPDHENSTGIMYEDYYKSYSYLFLIENQKVKSMAVVIPTLKLPVNLANFLGERYQIVALDGYDAAFLNEKKDMAVMISPSDNLANMFIMYVPYKDTKSGGNNPVTSNFNNTYKELKGES